MLIFYDHFYPAYKAGGPVQSLVNLVRRLHHHYAFYLVCKPHEMNEAKFLDGIVVNQWNNWNGMAKVLYKAYSFNKRQAYTQLLQETHPDVIFINGLFSLYYNILPLKYAIGFCRRYPNAKIVLSARGMMHPGALSQKAVKKKLFLSAFRLLGWHRKVKWHATDTQEKEFIKKYFGQNTEVETAGNFPNLLPAISSPEKKPGELIMGTIALISPMKNHLLIIRALKQITEQVTWLIYGPVKDEAYWQQCTKLIQQLPMNIKVQYKGELFPLHINNAMNSFQLFIMPSKSENFGHAILEALSAGKPVITTDTTPFKNLQQHKAGFSVSFTMIEKQLAEQISFFAKQDQKNYNNYTKNASAYASTFVNITELEENYKQLFS